MRALLLAAALAIAACPAMAKKLTIERIYDGGSLDGAAVRGLKVSPDGKRVTFLRAKADDQHTFDLWEYNLADQTHAHAGRCAVAARGRGPAVRRREGAARAPAHRRPARHRALPVVAGRAQAADPAGGALYLYDLDAPAGQARARRWIPAATRSTRRSRPRAATCPTCRDQNLWVIDLASGEAHAADRATAAAPCTTARPNSSPRRKWAAAPATGGRRTSRPSPTSATTRPRCR